MSPSILYLGLDVHKESVTIAMLPADAPARTRLEQLSYDLKKLQRCLARLAQEGAELRACCGASGTGYVLQRAITSWGHSCEIVASALIPTKPGDRRKHDRRDAANLARLSRAGELSPIRIPTEAEARVRETVRFRETLQREILRSRHYLLKVLLRQRTVAAATSWCRPPGSCAAHHVERGAHTPSARATAGSRRARVEGAAAPVYNLPPDRRAAPGSDRSRRAVPRELVRFLWAAMQAAPRTVAA